MQLTVKKTQQNAAVGYCWWLTFSWLVFDPGIVIIMRTILLKALAMLAAQLVKLNYYNCYFMQMVHDSSHC